MFWEEESDRHLVRETPQLAVAIEVHRWPVVIVELGRVSELLAVWLRLSSYAPPSQRGLPVRAALPREEAGGLRTQKIAYFQGQLAQRRIALSKRIL